MEIGKTPSGADGVLHHPPKAFNRVEMVSTMGWQEMEAKRAVVVLKGRVELVRPMHPAAIDDHHDLFLGFPEGGHDLVQILAKLLRIKMWDNLIEDFRGPILDGANDAEQHPAGDAAPGAILPPRLAFEGFLAFDLALA